MKIKLDLGEVTLDDVMTYGFYALFVVAFIQPLAASIYIAGLCMLPLLIGNELWKLAQRRKQAIERADYEACMRGEQAPDRGEVHYPEY